MDPLNTFREKVSQSFKNFKLRVPINEREIENSIEQIIQVNQVKSIKDQIQTALEQVIEEKYKTELKSNISEENLKQTLKRLRIDLIFFQDIGEQILKIIGKVAARLNEKKLSSKSVKLSIQNAIQETIKNKIIKNGKTFSPIFQSPYLFRVLKENYLSIIDNDVQSIFEFKSSDSEGAEIINNVLYNIGCFRSMYKFEDEYFFQHLLYVCKKEEVNELRKFFIGQLFEKSDFFNDSSQSQFCNYFFNELCFYKPQTNAIWKSLNGDLSKTTNDPQKVDKANADYREEVIFAIQKNQIYWLLFSTPSVMVYFPQMLFSYYSKKFRQIGGEYDEKLNKASAFINLYNRLFVIWKELIIIEKGSFLRHLPGFSDFIDSLKRRAICDPRLQIELTIAINISSILSDLEHNFLDTNHLIDKTSDFLSQKLNRPNDPNIPITALDFHKTALFTETQLSDHINYDEFYFQSFEWSLKILYSKAQDQEMIATTDTTQTATVLKAFQDFMIPIIVSRLFRFGPTALEFEKYFIDSFYNFLKVSKSPQSKAAFKNFNDLFEKADDSRFDSDNNNSNQDIQYESKIGGDIEDSNEFYDPEKKVHFFLIRDIHSSKLCTPKNSDINIHDDLKSLINEAFEAQAENLKAKHTKVGQNVRNIGVTYFYEESIVKFKIGVAGKKMTIYGHPFQVSILLWLHDSPTKTMTKQELMEKMKLQQGNSTNTERCTFDQILSTICRKAVSNKRICKFTNKKYDTIAFNPSFFNDHKDNDEIVLDYPENATFIHQQIQAQLNVQKAKRIIKIKELIIDAVKMNDSLGFEELISTVRDNFDEKVIYEDIKEAYTQLTNEKKLKVQSVENEGKTEYFFELGDVS